MGNKGSQTLTNLMQSIKANALNSVVPQKQAKKYHINLGQNVSRPFSTKLAEMRFDRYDNANK